MWKFLPLLIPLVRSVQGIEWQSDDEVCFSACGDAVGRVTFGTTVYTDDWYTGYCDDALRYESTYICAHIFCTPEEIKSGLAANQKWCDTVHMTILSYDAVMANYSEGAIKAMPRIAQDAVIEEVVNYTMVPDEAFFQNAVRTSVSILRIIGRSWLITCFR